MGCGYISIIDTENKVFSWGDNYAVIAIKYLYSTGIIRNGGWYT